MITELEFVAENGIYGETLNFFKKNGNGIKINWLSLIIVFIK